MTDTTDTAAPPPPRWAAGARVVTPTDTEDVAAALRDAAEERAIVVARGNGTKLTWGAPPRGCDLVVDTTRLAGIDHAAGDLVAQVGAGTPLARLREVLAERNQRLSVDEVVPGSTVGGVVATGLSGPSRVLYGPVRDLVIGMTVVYPDGRVAHSGGRVVKNVAGYDLGKLHTGALGTLGVITSVTVRLHPRPEATRVVRAHAADAATAETWLARVLGSQAVPSAVEVDAAPGDDGKDGMVVRVLLEGARGGIESRTADIAALLGDAATTDPQPPPGWGQLPGATTDTLLTLAVPVAATVRAVTAARAATGAAGLAVHVRGSAGAGVVHAALPGDADPDTVLRAVAGLRIEVAELGGSVVAHRVGDPVDEAGLDRWGEVPGLALMRAVKDRLDPGHRLAPGRFVGGI